MNFFKHYIGDYARATGDLTLAEYGAYRMMLDHFYGTARPLPSEKKTLYRLLRADSDLEKRAVDRVSLRFWRQIPSELSELSELLDLTTEDKQRPLFGVMQEWDTENGLINLRALGEIVKARVQGEKNRVIALAREKAKREAEGKQ